MPTYTFIDNITGFSYDEFMSMNEREKYLEDNYHNQDRLLNLGNNDNCEFVCIFLIFFDLLW